MSAAATHPQAFEPDYIVIGGGSAGAVIASRLSEDPTKKVLLIEAGGEARGLLIDMPAGYARTLLKKDYDWCYLQDEDPSIGGRRFIWSAGKRLGGSSSINGQLYIRGTAKDYDIWGEAGCVGWSYRDCLPYFMRAESFQGEPRQHYGLSGPQAVSPMRDPHPLVDTFLAACRDIGMPTLDDYFVEKVEGAFKVLASQKDGQRCSTEKGYLREARKRPNLVVRTHSFVEKILFDGTRAAGVLVRAHGKVEEIRTRGEIIVSSGSVASPSLLMRSGIGPASHLREKGVDVVADREEVGANLQEHVSVGINKYVNVPTYNSQTSPLWMMRHLWNYFAHKKGPIVTPAVQALGLARTVPDLAEPDIQLFFLPFSWDIEPETRSAALAVMPPEPTIQINASICHPASRGRIMLGDTADGPPRIAHQLLGADEDVETLVRAMSVIERIFEAPSWNGVVIGDRSPNPAPRTPEDWVEHVRMTSAVCYHPVGTCRMGNDPNSVVDPQLRVRGVTNLRVADASIMPRITSTNTNAPSIMIGEKAADLIRAVH